MWKVKRSKSNHVEASAFYDQIDLSPDSSYFKNLETTNSLSKVSFSTGQKLTGPQVTKKRKQVET